VSAEGRGEKRGLGAVRWSIGTFTVPSDFIPPFVLHVFKTVSRFNGKAKHNDMCIGVGKRPQSIEFLLACSIPQREDDMLIVDINVMDIIFKDGGFVGFGEESSRKNIE